MHRATPDAERMRVQVTAGSPGAIEDAGAPMATDLSQKTCPRCGKDVPGWRDHCLACGYDYRPPDLSARPRDASHRSSNPVGVGDMVIGGLICAVGIAVTAVTYNDAVSSGGGTYIVAWGAIVFGGIRFLRGLARFVG